MDLIKDVRGGLSPSQNKAMPDEKLKEKIATKLRKLRTDIKPWMKEASDADPNCVVFGLEPRHLDLAAGKVGMIIKCLISQHTIELNPLLES